MRESGSGKTEMSKLKILHAADFHLDTPFEGLPEEKTRQRRTEQRMLLLSLAELARSERVDLILLPGDLVDGEKVFYETENAMARAFGSVACPVVIAPGNHDCFTQNSLYSRTRLPDNVYIFRKNEIQCIEFAEIGARVFGAAFTDRSSRPLLEGFRAERTPGTLNLLCLHGEVDARESRYDPISSGQLAESGIDYAALGHIHKGSGLRKAGGTCYAWPGCPEGRGFDETGERFVNIVEIDRDSREVFLRTASIARRKYEILNVDITGAEPILSIHSLLPDDTQNDIYRIVLTGETDGSVDAALLRNSLEGLFFHLQILDETILARDIWEKAGSETLRGLFLARMRKLYDSAADEEGRAKAEQAARWGLAALDNMEGV